MLERALLERMPDRLELAVSATTRERRPGETHGGHYWFVSDEEFDRRSRRRAARVGLLRLRGTARDAALEIDRTARRARRRCSTSRRRARCACATRCPARRRSSSTCPRSGESSAACGSARPRAPGRSTSGSSCSAPARPGRRSSTTWSSTTSWSARQTSSAARRRRTRRCGYHLATMIHPKIDQLLGERRLALCARHRRRQARPADQQLLPPARRGHLRGSAAARGVPLEEPLDHVPRGSRRGQDQVRLTSSPISAGKLWFPAGPPPSRRGLRSCVSGAGSGSRDSIGFFGG